MSVLYRSVGMKDNLVYYDDKLEMSFMVKINENICITILKI